MKKAFSPSKIALFFIVPVLLLQPSEALFCADWCVEPYCSCRDLFPGMRSFLHNTLGFQSASNSPLEDDCFPQTGDCNPGFSGRECRCGYSRTNIADDSLLIPDSMKGSLIVTKTGSASGTLLAGTWQAGYEATGNDPNQFTSWFADDDENENVWSVGKTTSGNELIGSHDWIRLKKPSDAEFTEVLGIGAQGGFVVYGDTVFAGTFAGLYMSTDGGETWAKSPSDCAEYNWPDDPTTSPPGTMGPPRPPDDAKYCEAPVTHMFPLDDGSLIAFYLGYGGAHQIQLQNGDDPLLPESWMGFPSFQDTETCQSGFCHTYDAAILGNYMYVAFQSLSMVRIDLTLRQDWEQVTIGTNDLYPTAMTTTNNGTRLFVAAADGLYSTSDGVTWARVSDDPCSGRDKPPLMSRGMVTISDDASDSTVLVFGTVLGPWVYSE